MNFTGNIGSVLGCAIEKKTNIRYLLQNQILVL